MNVFTKLRDLVLPNMCVFCLHEVVGKDEYVCERCSEYLTRVQGSLCTSCGHAVHLCACNVPKSLTAARFVCWYRGAVKKLVHTMKEYRYDAVLDYAANRLYGVISENEYYASFDSITYVPRHPRSYKQTLAEPSYELAKRISEKMGIPLVKYLVRSDGGFEQKELSVKERAKNVRGVFSLAEDAPTPYGKIILVDDVMTTGNTANECARVLKKAGPCEVAGLFLTRTRHGEVIK